MITEFIDGLQQFHFLQNALITAIAIGIVAGAVGCFNILRGMSHGRRYLTRSSSWCGSLLYPRHQFLYWRYCLWPPGVRPYHLYQEQLHHQSDTAIGITFSSFLALGVILIESQKFHRPFPHPLLGISWPSRPGYVDNHRCWCCGLAGDCPTLSTPTAHIF